MIEVAIVEDDVESARALLDLLHRYEVDRGTRLAVTHHPDGSALVDGYMSSTDVLLLDVEMPGLDGLAVARLVRERDRDVAIVLVSHAVQHAARGYGVEAQAFLGKPVAYPALARELDRAVDRVAGRAGSTVLLSTDAGPLRLTTAEIVCLEARRRRVLVHTLDGRYVVHGPLKALADDVEPRGFRRVHHSFVVNLRHVVAVQQMTCHLVTRREIPVSRPHRSAFLAALTDHLAVRGS